MESHNELTQSSSKEVTFENLSELDRAFAVEYITNGFKHGDAAEKIGLARSTGLSKLRQPLVSAFITHLQDSSANAKLITQHFVEAKYLEVLPKLMGEEEVSIYNAKEDTVSKVKKFHSAEVVSVLRDLGKAAGYVAPEGPKGGNVSVTIDLGGFTGESPQVIIEHEEDDD